MAIGVGSVVAVRVGTPRTVEWLGRPMRTSIDKADVAGPVEVLATHLRGDRQSDPAQHGGPDKAVYAYSEEDARWWAARADRDPATVRFGENLRTRGLDLGGAVIGERWLVGTALLQVSEPRTPCWKLGYLWGDAAFPRRFAAARRTGVLLRVLRTGSLRAGDAVTVLSRPGHGVTVADVNAVYYERGRDTAPLFRAPELAAHWREWAAHRTVWHTHDERERGITVDE